MNTDEPSSSNTSTNSNITPEDAALRNKLNQETGKISWRELQPHFARGSVFHVERNADLVELALQISHDNKVLVQNYLSSGRLNKMSDESAACYRDEDIFWAVVVAPWVLVQELNTDG